MLPSLKATNMSIEYDGKLFEGEAMLFLVGLTNSIGGFEKLAPIFLDQRWNVFVTYFDKDQSS